MGVANLFEQLKRDEGYSLTKYPDSKQIPTIGIGHNLQARPRFSDGRLIPDQITDQECQQLFKEDYLIASQQLFHYLSWAANLDSVRQGVLLNMSFNMGMADKWPNPAHGLMTFTNFIKNIQIADYDNAAAHILSSLWAKQVGKRAVRLALQLITGTWQ